MIIISYYLLFRYFSCKSMFQLHLSQHNMYHFIVVLIILFHCLLRSTLYDFKNIKEKHSKESIVCTIIGFRQKNNNEIGSSVRYFITVENRRNKSHHAIIKSVSKFTASSSFSSLA